VPPESRLALSALRSKAIQKQRGTAIRLESRETANTHKSLNRLAAEVLEDTVDGAHVWQLDADDPPPGHLVHRQNRTRTLKFDHPGLDTAATRDRARLLIQNGIGRRRLIRAGGSRSGPALLRIVDADEKEAIRRRHLAAGGAVARLERRPEIGRAPGAIADAPQ
jgi:hypothetical protein